MARIKAWAVLEDPKNSAYERHLGGIVVWNCRTDDEEGVEIHRTRAEAKAYAFRGERVARVEIRIVKPRKRAAKG